ncbi:hypothetical protein SLEP1_g26526 [Rubroshorea leprosula]|nr:hypothetical protein SLEP1_g26526 [Rubroshorea leprosula]
MSITNMQPLLTKMQLLLAGLQNITQPSGAPVYAQPWQSQHNISISQVSRAATTTLPLTQPDGTSRMLQTLQSPGTSHGLPDISPLEQLAQTAHAQTNDVSPVFSLHQGQGRNASVESQPFTQGLSDQDSKLEKASSYLRRRRRKCVGRLEAHGNFVDKQRVYRIGSLGTKCYMEEQTITSPFTKGHPAIAASLVAENDPLKPEIQEKQELCHEDQQMKSNIEAFEAENERLKLEIDEKKQQMESNLKAFESQIRQLVDEFESLNVANVSVNIRTQTQSGEASSPLK